MKSTYKGKIEFNGQWLEIWETTEDTKIGIDLVNNATDEMVYGIVPEYATFAEALIVALNDFSARCQDSGDKMKPFDLDQALAGEPVKLRNGEKAFLLKKLNTRNPTKFSLQLLGYIIYEDNVEHDLKWTIDGSCVGSDRECPGDIIGMWESEKPTKE